MKRFFTLVELLIVIAIIAILAAMLLPALNQVRAKAQAVTCLSSKKQTAQIFMLYANDFNDQMPIHKLEDVSTAKAWTYPTRELYTYNYLKSPDLSKNVTDKLLLCPVAAQLSAAEKGYTPLQIATYGTVSYNGYYVNDKNFTKSLKLTTLKLPSACAMLGETYNGTNFMIYSSFCFPHQNSFSTAFFDAHIGMTSRREAPASSAQLTLPFWTGKP